jgi:hypothetical protein
MTWFPSGTSVMLVGSDVCMCGQFMYVEGPGQIGGTADGDLQPDFSAVLPPGEVITGVFGYYDNGYTLGPLCCNIPFFRSLGFRTSSGRQYGLYGPSNYGTYFSADWTVRGGFFGTYTENSNFKHLYLRSLGAWLDGP